MCLSISLSVHRISNARKKRVFYKTKALCLGLFALLNFKWVLEFRAKSRLIFILRGPCGSAGVVF